MVVEAPAPILVLPRLILALILALLALIPALILVLLTLLPALIPVLLTLILVSGGGSPRAHARARLIARTCVTELARLRSKACFLA